MEFGDLKKWHFGILLPLFTGLLVMAFLMMEPPDEGRRMAIQQFENEVLMRPVGKSSPQAKIQDIHVYPPINGLYVVNFKRLVEDYQNDNWKKQTWSFIAGKSPGGVPVPEWLAGLKQMYPERVSYTYEWWREPKRLWTIWGIFSGLLFLWGAAIPAVVWTIKGAGESKTVAAEDELALATAAKAGPTAADHDRLDEMLDRLEEETGAGAGPRVPGQSIAVGTGGDSVPVALHGKPLEAVAVAAVDEKPKDFKGEFYPVARKK